MQVILIRELSKITNSYSYALVESERINNFLSVELEVRDRPGARRAPRFRATIELDHVTFAYGPDRPNLVDVSLTIPAGSIAGVVGPTGAGKTTLINLIARFYDPRSGRVLIDGEDVQSFYQESLRERISFVLQDTLLFRGPVWLNIAYGKPEATRREIFRAAELANADAFIRELPEGYKTMVGERGVTLSGGQQRRIAIARHGAAKHRAASGRRAVRSLTSLRACDPLYGGPYSRRRWCFWIRGTGGAMRTQHLLAVSAILIAGTGTWVGVAPKIAAASAN